MLDFGVDFDDDLFEDTKQRSTESTLFSYNAKICEPQWFNDATIFDTGDIHTLYKCRGDLAFYMGQYQKALDCYDLCLEHLYSTNVPMLKDIEEAKARCYMHLSEKENALELAQKLMSMATNYDQHTSGLYLLGDIHKTFKQTNEELHVIQSLITLHTSNPDLWLRLAHLYMKLHDEQTSSHGTSSTAGHSTNHSTDHKTDNNHPRSKMDKSRIALEDERPANCSQSDDLRFKSAIGTCLLQARCLLRNVQNTISSFAKVRNLQMQETIDKELAQWDLSEDFNQLCLQFLYACKEQHEDTMPSDLDKLETLQKMAEGSFEDKWFSWRRKKY